MFEPRPRISRQHTSPAAQRVVDGLRAPRMIEHQTLLSIRAIVALRLLAVCGKTANEPLPLLTQRFASVTAAKAFIAFANLVGRFWPEPIVVMRPCCRLLSADEQTLTQLINAAANADRDGFAGVLDGFVRRDRQEHLFEQAKLMVALIS